MWWRLSVQRTERRDYPVRELHCLALERHLGHEFLGVEDAPEAPVPSLHPLGAVGLKSGKPGLVAADGEWVAYLRERLQLEIVLGHPGVLALSSSHKGMACSVMGVVVEKPSDFNCFARPFKENAWNCRPLPP